MPFPGEEPTPMPGPIGHGHPDSPNQANADMPFREVTGTETAAAAPRPLAVPGMEDADFVPVGPDGPPDPTPEQLAAAQAELGEESTLLLSPEDGKATKLKCPKCDHVNKASDKTCSKCGHALGEARKAKFAKLSADPPADPPATEDDPEASADLYSKLSLAAGDGGESGDLVWKAICKTGTLALSPGPGQIDVDKPLVLSEEMFDDLIMSVEEKAFPHVTVPGSHENGIFENTGYVRELQKREAPDGEKYLMAGIEFTEPDVKQRVLNGSIPDTSVGVKFNYRNKRTGKMYPAALEHVALTPIPWVDGLPAFGADLSQPYDQERQESEEKLYAGVFSTEDAVRRKPARPARKRPARAAKPAKKDLSADRKPASSRGILPERRVDGSLPSMSRTATTRRASRPAPRQTTEQLLAAQQARSERQAADLQLAQQETAAARAEAREANKTLALSAAREKVAEFQRAGHSAAVCQRYEQIALAAVEAKYSDDADDNMTLSLSVTPATGGDPVDTEMGPVEVAEYLLSAITPVSDAAQEFLSGAADLHASAKPSEKSAAERADEIERQAHPERYKEDGTRKDASEIEASPGGSF